MLYRIVSYHIVNFIVNLTVPGQWSFGRQVKYFCSTDWRARCNHVDCLSWWHDMHVLMYMLSVMCWPVWLLPIS